MFAAIVATTGIAQAQPSITLGEGTVLTKRLVADNIGHPATLVYDADGSLWMTDRGTGRVLRIDPGTGIATTVLEIPLTSRPDEPTVKGGVFGLALHPQFATGERWVFISTTTADDRLVVDRYWFSGDKLVNGRTIFSASSVPHTLGLTLEALNDGTLLVSVASFDTQESKRLDKVNGKIIRMTFDGLAVPSNPLYDAAAPASARSYIYTYGHRNPLGITQIPSGHATLAGSVFATECGPMSFDEINRLEPGMNYGYMNVAGYCNGTSYGFACPLATMNQAPSGLVYYHSDAIPEWKGDLLMGTLRGNGMVVADLTDDGHVSNIDPERTLDDVMELDADHLVDCSLGGERSRVIDLAVSPDGRIYAALYEGGDARRGRIVALENPAVHQPLSVDDGLTAGIDMRYGPNPVGDLLTVSLDAPCSSAWTATVVDLEGRAIISSTYSAQTTTVTLNTGGLSAGAYLLVVRDAHRTRSAAFVR
jgi:glucose/arabinose dehydrogenase